MTYQSPKNKINLTAPWAKDLPPIHLEETPAEIARGDIPVSQYVSVASDALGAAFLQERSRVHETYIKEQERTKRIGMILAAILILAAAALILFAPAGRETLSYWIGAALVIFAAGSMGYQRIWGKSKNLSFGADQDRNNLERQ